ncbi:hypothetical protein JSE7799_01550 [Jannaschia seosinensis]|uniref:Lipoprotein n=1 Tax=Jannaschia seosinensis TaxID=313367 RepID=A0A0M7BAI5_9RHOB|nr:hypothetical protein [Jannaschia seosinensis]CUH38832.1 hypothetical protein JSE7799_01550 [Jannaschia seosinensis]
MRGTIRNAVVATFLATPVAAQGAGCAPRDVVVDRLDRTYGEVYAGGGLRGRHAIFEIWISAEDGTWTILMTRPDGIACVMAAGTNWHPAMESQQIRDTPA